MGGKAQQKEVEEIVRRHCSDFEIDAKGGKHMKVTLHKNGQTRKIVTSSTPSDHRARKNFESDIKRALRNME